MSRPWPLVGRERELARIREGLSDWGGFYLIGSAGVGKSRLLVEISDMCAERGDEVISITGAESATEIPLRTLLGAVDLRRDVNLPQLVINELAERARRRRIVLVVDDAHLIDPTSTALLHNIARSKIASMVLALNSGETDASGIHSLWVDGYIDRIEVNPLDRPSTAALTQALLGQISPSTEAWLWDICRGRPLYLREVLAWAEDASAISRVDGVVHIETERVPPRLREIVGLHLRRLGHELASGVATVEFAQPIEVDLARRLMAGETLDGLLDRGLVTSTDGVLRVAHPLYGEVAVATLSSGKRDELRVAIADQLMNEPGHEIQAAGLFLSSGRTPPVTLLETAVDSALLYRQGALGERLSSVLVDARGTVDDLVRLASARALQGEWEKANALFEQALKAAPDEIVPAVWLAWINASFETTVDPRKARELAAGALAAVGEADRGPIEAMWLRCRMFLEPLAPVHEALVDLAARGVDHRYIPLDIITSGWHLLRLESGLEWTDRAIAATQDDPLENARARQVGICVKGWAMGLREAEKLADEFVRWAEKSMHPDNAVLARCATVIVAARTGDAASTLSAIECLRVDQERSLHLQHLPLILAEKALAESALIGEEARARETLESIAGLPEGAAVITRALALMASARLAHRAGELEQARELLHVGIEQAEWRNSVAHELLCRREYLYLFGPDLENVDRISEIGDQTKIGLPTILAREARAAFANDAMAMDGVTEDAWRYGALCTAWESSALAHRLHSQRGDFRSALRAELRWKEIGRVFNDQFSPARPLIEAVLTDREYQVAKAVSAGMTNREAGETLFISPKTIKRHLERIYEKLGIHSRQELGEVLHTGLAPPVEA